jgi:hypothetical protein
MSVNKNYDDVNQAFQSGEVLKASDKELEQLLMALCTAQVLSSTNQTRSLHMGETLRGLLAVRESEARHKESQLTSKLALLVAFVALIVSIPSAIEAYKNFDSTCVAQKASQ